MDQNNIQPDDLLEQAFEDMDNKLNLTADDKEDEDIHDEQIEQEYLKFMSNLNGAPGENTQDIDPMVGQLTNLMGQLLKDISEESKDAKDQPQDKEKIKDMFSKMENNQQFDQFADQLLYQFMDKDILEAPLKEATLNYTIYLEKNKDKLTTEEQQRYRSQQKCLDLILELLQRDPSKKDELVKLFEQMQELGNPPEEIFGADSPLAMINSLSEQQGQEQEGGAPKEECGIF